MKIILFQLIDNNMIVYYKAENNYIPYKFGDANLYWRDNIDLDGYGPFTTLYSLMKHYENIIAVRKTQKVLHVDFTTKKRLE